MADQQSSFLFLDVDCTKSNLEEMDCRICPGKVWDTAEETCIGLYFFTSRKIYFNLKHWYHHWVNIIRHISVARYYFNITKIHVEFTVLP